MSDIPRNIAFGGFLLAMMGSVMLFSDFMNKRKEQNDKDSEMEIRLVAPPGYDPIGRF